MSVSQVQILYIRDADTSFQHPKEECANEIAMLLANMAKDDAMQRIFDLKRAIPEGLSTSVWVIDQLLDCFVKGAEGAYNKHANYDYLAYFFADLAKVCA
jgi:hypothetical protein